MSRPSWTGLACGFLAAVCACAGATLAWHHPLWPVALLILFALWCVLAVGRPGLWLMVVPACLPFLNFSPWTGWLIFEEFDILLLGALTAGYWRLARGSPAQANARIPAPVVWIAILLGSTGLLALTRGMSDAGGFSLDWFAGYEHALNSVRVFKSLGFALLFFPLLAQEMAHSRALASLRLARGMVASLVVVTLAVLWERNAFPGLFEFSEPYRTVALFWEMHVGGAAIDAYLVVTVPFVVWALRGARSPWAWCAAAALALMAGYACLTTFSRGVYLAVIAPLLLLGGLLWHQARGQQSLLAWAQKWLRLRPKNWRWKADLWLACALVAEVILVMGGGNFMVERLSGTQRDFGNRLAHWQQGLGLLEGPEDWLLGKGLGRLPANYARQVPQGEFSGSVKWGSEPVAGGGVNGYAVVGGPATMKKLGAQFAMTQRVSKVSAGPHLVSLDIRVQKSTDIYVELCERHLLYDGACQRAWTRIAPGSTAWTAVALPLRGPVLQGGPGGAPRMLVLSVSVGSAGGVADFDNVQLLGAQQRALHNSGFSEGLAHWFAAAQAYFLPWHIDNLFLELLIERGVLGLVLFAALMWMALRAAVSRRDCADSLSPYLAACLSAVLLVGLVSSVMDVPRVAFLVLFLSLFSMQTLIETKLPDGAPPSP